jgi:PAS domain-containing protein
VIFVNGQKPLELILARNLLSSIATPAFLLGEGGVLLFFNEAAAAMLGRRFEEIGSVGATEWTAVFGPFDGDDRPLPYEEISATLAVRENRPHHGTFRICGAGGRHFDVEASSIPIIGPDGTTGGIVLFWPATAEEVAG